MNWTDLQEIEQKIVEKQYSYKEELHYLLGSAILYTLSYFLLGEEYENGCKLAIIPALCITIITSILSLKTYAKNVDTDLYKDYFASNWVIGWRIYILGLFFISLVIILGFVFLHNYDLETFTPKNNLFLIGFELCFRTIFYLLIYRSFKRVSSGKTYKS